MGPKRQNEKDSSANSVTGDQINAENGQIENEHEQLREKLLIAEREKSSLIDRLRSNEEGSVHQRDDLVRTYQERINDINLEKDRQIRELESERNALREVSSRNGMAYERPAIVPNGNRRSGYEVPLPRQLLFDGKNSWESFIHPFEAMVTACRWDDGERLFRLTNSLRGEAAEYAFRQISGETLNDYQKLKSAMEARFKEKRSTSSYLSELESRRFNKEKEPLGEYVADIKRLVLKGYPTADNETRETINLRHFMKGLLDSQAALFIGMKEPKSIDQAREMLETYSSLREDVKGVRIRNVESKSQPEFVTEARLQEFGRDIKSTVGKKIDNLANLMKQQDKTKQRDFRPTRRDLRSVECYKCHEYGHYAMDCPPSINKKGSVGATNQGN